MEEKRALSDKITFDYFYGQESEMHAYYRLPKLLFTNKIFRNMSSDAKILYGLMLDRIGLSVKNGRFLPSVYGRKTSALGRLLHAAKQ
jgi:hypothetical protein